MKLSIFADILKVKKIEFLEFRIFEILNFHPCVGDWGVKRLFFSNSTRFGVWVIYMNGTCNGTIFSSPELKAHGWANRIPVTPSSVPPQFQTSSLKPLGQLNSNFKDWGTKVCSNGPGHMTKMAAMPIYGKNPLKSSPEPEGRLPQDLVCSIGDVGPTKFVQMMILGWPWPT